MRFDVDSRIIVTGPTGAVGNALVDELVSCGSTVIAVCRPASPRIENLKGKPGVEIVECELSEYAQLPDMVGESYDAFFHLAWEGTSGFSRQDWSLQAANVAYALEASKIAHILECGVFVGVGSQAEYGRVEGMMHPEDKCRPVTGYGAAKLAAGEMTRAYCQQGGVRHEWCRILSLFGPGDRPQSLVMDVIYSLLAGVVPECTPCEQIWDYIYAKDAARALRLVAELGIDGETYLIASGESRPLKDFVSEIRDVVSPGVKVEFGSKPYFPNQVMRLEADISNLVKDTGFELEYSFRDGIRETTKWASEHPAC